MLLYAGVTEVARLLLSTPIIERRAKEIETRLSADELATLRLRVDL